MPENSLTFSQTVDAPMDAVFTAFTNQTAITQWLCHNANISPRKGGALFLLWTQPAYYYAVGEFTAFEPGQQLAFTWFGRGEPAPTAVTVELAETAGGTAVTLTHTGVGADPAWAETRQQIEQGWETSLANLKAVLETGLDQRIYARPFLGILVPGLITADQAQDQGLPIEGGIQIGGTVAGTGAEAAGLVNEDILVKLGGVAVKDFNSLQAATAPHRAGDTVPLEFYRQGEKHSVAMTLSHRPRPAVPATPATFAAALREQYDGLDAELAEILAGVDDTLAAFKPNGLWSAKELLAHLITSERAQQMAVASSIDGNSLSGWPNNTPAWVASVAESYTLDELVDLWHAAEAETVKLVEHLPADTVANKAVYLGIGQSLLMGFPNHTRNHYGELRRILTAAREAQGVTDPA